MSRSVLGDADEGLASRIDVGRREDSGDARRALCWFDVKRHEVGMWMGAAHKAGMQHARQLDVIDVSAAPANETRVFLAQPRDSHPLEL